jgi:dTMP kinase
VRSPEPDANDESAPPVSDRRKRASPSEAAPTAELAGSQGLKKRIRSSTYGRLLTRENFRLLWLAQVVSTVGTYAYSLAIASLLTQNASGASLARAVSFVIGIQAGAAAVTGLVIAGPVADRFDRRRTMIVSDIVRFCAVATLLVGSPSTAHIALVAALLGSFGALFDPCLTASLPNVVDEEEVVPANAVIGGTFYGSAMIGPGLGAALVTILGVRLAFSLNALSFVASAALLAATTFRHSSESTGRLTPAALVRDLREGARHVRSSRLAIAILITMGIAMIAGGAQAPLQIVFVKQVLAVGASASQLRAVAFATLTTAWALGMLIGSLGSPVLIRRVSRERLIPLALAGVGTCVFLGAMQSSLLAVAALWFSAGSMCGITNVCYESLLQERTPDRFRGRVMATIEASQEATFLLGVAFAALLSILLASPEALKCVGVLSVIAALVGSRLLRRSEVETTVTGSSGTKVATELRTRPNAVAGGPWPAQFAVPAAWMVTRRGLIADVEMRWPLVLSDWDGIIEELSEAIEQGARVVVLPTKLPSGSRVSPKQLDELWLTLVDMSITVERTGGAYTSPSAAAL